MKDDTGSGALITRRKMVTRGLSRCCPLAHLFAHSETAMLTVRYSSMVRNGRVLCGKPSDGGANGYCKSVWLAYSTVQPTGLMFLVVWRFGAVFPRNFSL